MKKETKVICPVCKSEIIIPEHESVITGTTVAKDSELGTIELKVKKEDKRKAADKIAALRDAGVNVSNLFALRDVHGVETVCRLDDGKLTMLADDDPLFNAILESGTVPNKRLFRRWVLVQMFRMMTVKPFRCVTPMGFDKALKSKGFGYMLKMLVEEYRVQSILSRRDPENFKQRNMWFNNITLACIIGEYSDCLEKRFKTLPELSCKGVPYKKLNPKYEVFDSDFYRKVYNKLVDLKNDAVRSDTADKNYMIAFRFMALAKKFWYDKKIPMSKYFIDAYKGAGAYFSMRNLILFHGCKIKASGEMLSKDASIIHLDDVADKHHNEGWYMFGMLKQLLKDNNIDIEKKMQQWRKLR